MALLTCSFAGAEFYTSYRGIKRMTNSDVSPHHVAYSGSGLNYFSVGGQLETRLSYGIIVSKNNFYLLQAAVGTTGSLKGPDNPTTKIDGVALVSLERTEYYSTGCMLANISFILP
jgi:hypothetical protein